MAKAKLAKAKRPGAARFSTTGILLGSLVMISFWVSIVFYFYRASKNALIKIETETKVNTNSNTVSTRRSDVVAAPPSDSTTARTNISEKKQTERELVEHNPNIGGI